MAKSKNLLAFLYFLGLFFLLACSSQEQSLARVFSPELKEKKFYINDNISCLIYYNDQELEYIAKAIKNDLFKINQDLKEIFEVKDLINLEIVLIDQDIYHLKTGTPKWVFAFYHKSRIYIKVDPGLLVDSESFYRTLKHEYVHFLTDNLSAGNIPVWFDEGLAKWIEDPRITYEKEFFKDWTRNNSLFSTQELNKSFTVLEGERSKMAYLYAKLLVARIINKHQTNQISNYLRMLSINKELAFINTFRVKEESFITEANKIFTKN